MLRRNLLLPVLGVACAVILTGCPDKKPKYPACGKDEDCKEGQHCVNKKCVQCGQDSHCGPGEKCQDGACIEAKAECLTDDQCGEGQVCKDGACRACESDNECGPGGKCQAGACERPKACKTDEDCADDEDCIDGRCQQPWKGSDKGACKLETVFFQYDQATIIEAARAQLDSLAECLRKSAPDASVYVVGHADESGTEEYNIALSERRARAVADYLARLGVDPARFRIVPKGESEPSGRGAEADRRVEFEWQ